MKLDDFAGFLVNYCQRAICLSDIAEFNFVIHCILPIDLEYDVYGLASYSRCTIDGLHHLPMQQANRNRYELSDMTTADKTVVKSSSLLSILAQSSAEELVIKLTNKAMIKRHQPLR